MLPAPLAVSKPPMSSSSSAAFSRSSEDNYTSDMGSTSHQRLIPSPQSVEKDQYSDLYESPISPAPRYPAAGILPEMQMPRGAVNNNGNTRSSTAPHPFPVDAYNPFRNSNSPTVGYDEQTAYFSEPDEATSPAALVSRGGRGVRLTDSGPVPGPEGVRRVSRPSSRRPTSQAPPQNRYSRGSTYNLPPGAAPPQTNYPGASN